MYRTKAEMPDYTDPPEKFSLKKSYPILYTMLVGLKASVLFALFCMAVFYIPYYLGVLTTKIFHVNYELWHDVSFCFWGIGAIMIIGPILVPYVLYALGKALTDPGHEGY